MKNILLIIICTISVSGFANTYFCHNTEDTHQYVLDTNKKLIKFYVKDHSNPNESKLRYELKAENNKIKIKNSAKLNTLKVYNQNGEAFFEIDLSNAKNITADLFHKVAGEGWQTDEDNLNCSVKKK